MTTTEECCEMKYAIINNIPENYHSADLRNFFSNFVETGRFSCFHYRHRLETPAEEKRESASLLKKTCCCVIKMQENHLKLLIKFYHRKHWLDRNGDSLSCYCCITKIRVSSKDCGSNTFKTRAEQNNIPADRQEFTETDLLNLPELYPPDVMPNGNVGTPTLVFLDLIKQCRLPSTLIKKLGLSFPKTRTQKKYGNVPYDYGDQCSGRVYHEQDKRYAVTGSGHVINSTASADVDDDHHDDSNSEIHLKNNKKQKLKEDESNVTKIETAKSKRKKDQALTRKLMNENIEKKYIKQPSESDSDTCEEWERHEALTDDPANQERNKERLFEEEIELKWEKGGSGLVFYTDAQFWHQQEGDFDEQTADDLNVDMSGYYEEGAGDKDARDYITLRQEQRRRDGLEDTDFVSAGIGKFEKHTKGFGRKILTQQGWKEGQGLGNTVRGIVDALDNEGQNPRDRKGFGYRGEKVARYIRKAKKRRADGGGIITTVYDNCDETDPPETLLRTCDPYGLKYRNKYKNNN